MQAPPPYSAVQPAVIGLPSLPAPGETITLDIIPGPRCDWFNDEALDRLTSQCWQVTPQSNRIGLRLQGSYRLHAVTTANYPVKELALVPSRFRRTGNRFCFWPTTR
jgi:allophanate hydrolase subunit 2